MKWNRLILSLASLLLALLSFGAVREFGQDIGYPANTAFSIRASDPSRDKMAIFETIQQEAKENHLLIYKPYLDQKGKKATFIFGKSSDTKVLANTNLTGMYYSSTQLSSDLKTYFDSSGITYQEAAILWQTIPIYFLFTNLRSLAVWILFFILLVLLYAMKMQYLKKYSIERSLGLLVKGLRKETISEVLTLVLTSALLFVLFVISQGSLETVLVKSFGLLLLCNSLILLLITLLVNVLFYFTIRWSDLILLLKNRKQGGFIRSVWLVIILISIFLLGLISFESKKVLDGSYQRISVLDNWQMASQYSNITWFDQGQAMGENPEEDAALYRELAQKNRAFIQSFQGDDLLYYQASTLGNVQMQYAPEELLQELQAQGISNDIANNLYYVNTGVILKNQAKDKDNAYGDIATSGMGIIFVPEDMVEKTEEIKKLVNYELFTGSNLSADSFEVRQLPTQQKTFLFNNKGEENDAFALQEVEDKILVMLDFTKIPSDEAFDHFYSNVAFVAIYKDDLIEPHLSAAGLSDNLSNTTNAAEVLLLEKNRISNQLTGTVIAIVALIVSNSFIFYEYLQTVVRERAKKMAILSLLGRSIYREILFSIKWLLFGIAATLLLLFVITGSWPVVLSFAGLYLLEILVLTTVVWHQVRERRAVIMKGDFELL